MLIFVHRSYSRKRSYSAPKLPAGRQAGLTGVGIRVVTLDGSWARVSCRGGYSSSFHRVTPEWLASMSTSDGGCSRLTLPLGWLRSGWRQRHAGHETRALGRLSCEPRRGTRRVVLDREGRHRELKPVRLGWVFCAFRGRRERASVVRRLPLVSPELRRELCAGYRAAKSISGLLVQTEAVRLLESGHGGRVCCGAGQRGGAAREQLLELLLHGRHVLLLLL